MNALDFVMSKYLFNKEKDLKSNILKTCIHKSQNQTKNLLKLFLKL